MRKKIVKLFSKNNEEKLRYEAYGKIFFIDYTEMKKRMCDLEHKIMLLEGQLETKSLKTDKLTSYFKKDE